MLTYAGGVKGRVATMEGESLPYAGITVKGTSQGTMANEEGVYAFALAPGNYVLVFQYLGFKTKELAVIVDGDFQEQNVSMEVQALNLSEAVIGDLKEDPATTIMRKTIAKAKFHQLQVRSYTAKVYSRASAVATGIPTLLQKRLKKEGIEEGKAFLNESVAEVKYRRPNSYKQKIVSTRNSLDNSFPSPNEFIMASIYSPRVAGAITPLSPQAFSYYRFSYEGYFEDQGHIINKIKVIPKAYGEGVFKGSIYIIEGLWAIHSYDLQTTTSGLDIAAKQIFSPVKRVWLPVNQQFKLQGGYLGFSGQFKYLVSVNYSQLDVDPNLQEEVIINDRVVQPKLSGKKNLEDLIKQQKQFSSKAFRKLSKEYAKEKIKENPGLSKRMVRSDSIAIDSMANKRDTTYWAELRPVPLTPLEVKSYAIQDSIKLVKEVRNEVKKPDSTHFKLQHLILGNSYALGNRNYLESPVVSLNYNSVEGAALNFLTEWRKEWGISRYLLASPYLRYSIGRKRLYGTLLLRTGNRNWDFSLVGGELASQLNEENPVEPFPNSVASRFFDRNLVKLYQNQFVKTDFFLRNMGDILDLYGSLELQSRKELYNLESAASWIRWDRYGYTPNRPLNDEISSTAFPEHRAVMLSLRATLKPWAKYIVRNGQKRYLPNRGPVFNAQYKQAFSGLGDVSYTFLEAGVTHSARLGPRSNLKYAVSGGGFTRKSTLYFPDYKHFMGNEFFLQIGDPLNNFRMLPYYRYSTNSWFAQAHAYWTFQRFMLTRLEAVRLTGVKETLQLHALKVPSMGNYLELGYGLDEVLRIARIEVIGQFHGARFQGLGFRVGTSIQVGKGRR
ncbi:DUF5686 and carboxypeptidase regulatory-like domain-containing protein [Dyadobacter tibetensis]|uniref:DUF5686 and carboxypeptidase regulatory-like domain-containing protein n=1 Tax=Dyadobacter tibetensis TaxID=1211851 RepID=UPI000470AE60|nr:DUF5686 and carboxypeptidase regulatory-like domain-containing protein [Dyadobacter tibetensis]